MAAGEGVAGDGDAAGELSLSEEGAGINESKESLAPLGEGVDVGLGLAGALIGVALGLYICAHPAANAVNVLFFEPDLLRHLSE